MSRANPASAEASAGVREQPAAAATPRTAATTTNRRGVPAGRCIRAATVCPNTSTRHVMSRDRTRARKGAATAVREQLQQEQRRKRLRRAIGGAVLVAVAAGAAYRMFSDRQFTAGIVTSRYPAAQHVAGPITYRESPPMGGPHN